MIPHLSILKLCFMCFVSPMFHHVPGSTPVVHKAGESKVASQRPITREAGYIFSEHLFEIDQKWWIDINVIGD